MKRFFNKYPILSVLILMTAAFTPIMLTRDFSPSNELRYLNIVDEAVSEGHVFAFTNQGQPYADKPPLYFWLMMLSRMLTGEHSMFFLALLSLIPAGGIIAVMDKWLRTAYPGRFSPSQRAGAALLLGTSGLFLGMSVFLRMDMLMCFWIVMSLWTFWRLDHGTGREKLLRNMLPVYIFLALFTKGPVGLMMPVLSILVYLISYRRWKDISHYLGLRTWGIIAGLCVIWFTGVWIDGGKEYLNNLLFHQTVGRAVNSFHHKAPVWYYLTAIWEVLAPWCLATVPAVIAALLPSGKGEESRSPAELERFFALTAVSTLIMLSCFSSKLAIYIAPIFPFAAYLFPICMDRRGMSRWYAFALGAAAFLLSVTGVLVAVVSAVCIIFPSVPEVIDYPFLGSGYIFAAGLVLFAGGAKALGHLRHDSQSWHRTVSISAYSMLAAVFLAGMKMPQINDFVGYGNVCSLVPEEGQVYTLGVRRPENMDVYLGRDIYDFAKESGTFLMLAPKTGTLVVSMEFLGKHEDVMDYLEGMRFTTCGPYAVYNLGVYDYGSTKAAKSPKEKRRDRKRGAE